MKANLKEQIFKADDSAVHGPIEIEEWGLSVWIRPLSFPQRLELQQRLKALDAKQKDEGFGEAVIIASAVQDEDGQLIFEGANPHDIERLARKNPGIITWLAMEVMSHNRMTDRAIEGARKNSKSAQSSILPFRSPGHLEKASENSSN